MVEKVVILGLQPDRSYTASSGSSTFAVRSGVGIDPRISKGSAVMVRATNLPLTGDWTLKVTEDKGIATE